MGRGDINQPRATSGQFVGIDAALPEPDGNNPKIAVFPDASADFKTRFLKGDSIVVGFQNTGQHIEQALHAGADDDLFVSAIDAARADIASNLATQFQLAL